MRFSGFRAIQANTSTEAPIAAVVPRSRAKPRAAAGAFAAATFAASEETSIGPMSCEPQRGCSLGARSPSFSYGPDRDVLGTVVLGKPGPPEREGGRQQAHRTGRQLLPAGRQGGSAQSSGDHRGRDDRSDDRRPGKRKTGLRKRSVHDGEQGKGFGEPQRAAQHRCVDGLPEARLLSGRDVQHPVLAAYRRSPGGGAVDEHAVLQRHPTEPNVLLFHDQRVAASSRSARWSVSAAGPRPSRRPSISTTGMISRTDEEVNASSAPRTSSSGKASS